MYHLTADSEVVFFSPFYAAWAAGIFLGVEVWTDAIAWILIWGGEI